MHEAQSENMSFQSKNFSYVTKAFGTFLDEVHAGGRQYLRSISAEEPSKLPANLALDFPGLENDFRLPEPFSLVTERAHSSPLRISGPVTLWLHYDVSFIFGEQLRFAADQFPAGDGECLVSDSWRQETHSLPTQRCGAPPGPCRRIELYFEYLPRQAGRIDYPSAEHFTARGSFNTW